MRQRAIAAFLLTASVFAFAAENARAHDPEDVFDRCVSAVRQSVRRCTNANTTTTKECLRKVRALLEAGNRERARAVANECIDVIEGRTRRCNRHIRAICRECIEVLVDMGATELARRLHHACENAVEQVNQNARRGINAIKGAFD